MLPNSILLASVAVLYLPVAVSQQVATDRNTFYVAGSVMPTGVPNDRVYTIDAVMPSKEVFWTAPEGYVRYVQLSPRGDLLAVCYLQMGKKQPESIRTPLLLMTVPTKQVTKEFPCVKRFCWNPGGNALAYIPAKMDENYLFISEGTYIYDLQTDSAKQVYSAGERVHWSQQDNLLYIRDHEKVVKYDPETQAVSDTEYHGVQFSPDYKFYYQQPDEQFVVYEAATNTSLSASYPSLFEDASTAPHGWFGDHLLAYKVYTKAGELTSYLLDCSTGFACSVP